MKKLLLVGNLLLGISVHASPFYPIPAYLSANADKVKPNVMLMMDTSGSMGWTMDGYYGCRVGDCRITTAKNAFIGLVNNNKTLVRWGFSSFYKENFIPIGDSTADEIITTINSINIRSSGTPTMPIYYQLLRYYMGYTPTVVATGAGITYYGDWTTRRTAPSPMQYRCQKNFIIAVSDGDAGTAMGTASLTGDTVFNALPYNDYWALPKYTEKAFNTDLRVSGNDLEGKSWQDPNFRMQNIITYTIGFGPGVSPNGTANLEQAGIAGGGAYKTAGDEAGLIASLQDALASIAAKVIAQAPPAYVSDPTVSGAVTIKYRTANWSSDINVYASNSDGSVSNTVSHTVTTPNGNRNIYVKTDVGTIKKLVNTAEMATNVFGVSTTEMTQINTWLQGSKAKDATYRASVLGDVINSNVSMMYQGKAFVVGANDGMVHVYKPNSVGNYVEALAYMPTQAKSMDGVLGRRIPSLTKVNYGLNTNQHKYFVDGGTYYRGDSTGSHIVVGSTGRGGSGVYALDMANVRDNATPNENAIIFDLTNGSNSGYNNLGYSVGNPIVVKVKDGGGGRLVALVNNGYYSTDISIGAQGIPTLYAVNLQVSKGTVFKEFLVDVSTTSAVNNGLSSVVAFDKDKDGFADFAYAGDLKGDLYKFNLETGTSKKIFSGDPSKPITAAPVVFTKNGKTTVIFGTGKLLTEPDNRNTLQQSMYGITDDDSLVSVSDLVQQTLTPTDRSGYRYGSYVPMDATHKGWTVNLGASDGERVIYQPTVNVGTVFFTTQIISPPDDKLMCAVGSGSGYVMALDAETGGHPLDDNSKFSDDETGTGNYAGKKYNSFITGLGGMIQAPSMSAFGSDMYGQSIPGYVDSSYKPKDSPRNSCLKTSVTTEDRVEWLCVEEGIKPKTKGGSKIRVLSWREIF